MLKNPQNKEWLLALYKSMIRTRLFEERVADLVETNEIHCPCHLYIGQEAIATGVCDALETPDVIWGCHRSHGHYLAKGGDLKSMMTELYGKVTGCSRGRGGSMHIVDPAAGIPGTVPLVAATIPMSVGAALAFKLKKQNHVSVAFFGDGAVEEGHFNESMNIAAVYRLPVIFICENNLYASHMFINERRRFDNIVKYGEANGMASQQIDGNNVLEVYQAAQEAVVRAKSGEGPTFLECRTFRWRGHVGPAWDMDVGLQRKDELQAWLPKDPIARIKKMMSALGVGEDVYQKIDSEIKKEIEDAVTAARNDPYPAASELRDHVFASREGGVS